MRRKRQQLSQSECEEMLARTTHGTLAVNGDDGYPYAVPVSHAWHDGRIYLHSAPEGHKLDAIRRDSRVTYCVVGRDEVRPAEFTTYYASVIAFGKARVVTDDDGKRKALHLLADKYSHGQQGTEDEIARGIDRLVIVEIEVVHMTGKAAIEIVRQRAKQE